jgi:hypothetical protein
MAVVEQTHRVLGVGEPTDANRRAWRCRVVDGPPPDRLPSEQPPLLLDTV